MTSTTSTWTPPSLGAPCWISIPATDVGRAKRFYEAVFDWTFRAPPDAVAAAYPPSELAMFSISRPDIMGGIFKLDTEHKSKAPDAGAGVIVYLLVDDIEAAFEKARKAGGSVVMEKVADGDHTLRGKVADTEGNVIGILKWLC
jgi:uncharacterized protein